MIHTLLLVLLEESMRCMINLEPPISIGILVIQGTWSFALL